MDHTLFSKFLLFFVIWVCSGQNGHSRFLSVSTIDTEAGELFAVGAVHSLGGV